MLDYSLDVGMWGSSGPKSIDYDFKNLYFEKQGSPSLTLPFGFGGPLYASLNATVGLNYDLGFGLLGRAKLDLGGIKVNYSIDPNAVVSSADKNLNMDGYVDTSGFVLGDNSLTATGLDLANSFINLDLGAKLKASLFGSIGYKAGVDFLLLKGSVSGSKSFSTKLVDFDKRINLINIDGSKLEPVVKDFSYGQLTAQLPKFSYGNNVAGGDALGSLSLSGTSDKFATASLDIDAAIVSLFGLPPNLLSGSFGFDIGVASAKVNYNILDAKLTAGLSLEQEFNFKPTVDVTMTTDFGQTITGTMGEKFTFDTPEGEGTFDVDADYHMQGAITSTTYIRLSSSFDYKLLGYQLAAKLGINVLGKYIGGSWNSSAKNLLEGSVPIGGGARFQLFSDTSTYDGGSFSNTYSVSYEKFVTANSGKFMKLTTHQETAEGGEIANKITGNILDNKLMGMAGDDTLIGGIGADLLDGGDDTDEASYADAAEGISADLADTSLNWGEAKGDTYVSIERLLGSSFADRLGGDDGANKLSGGDGDDTLIGRGGGDELVGGDGKDVASYSTAAEKVIASLADPSVNMGDASGDTYSGIENLRGSKFNDELVGNRGDNTLLGGDGDDVLTGGGGADRLLGGGGNNTASYAGASTGVRADLGNPKENTKSAAGDFYNLIQNLIGTSKSDRLTGDKHANKLEGGRGWDKLDGKQGNDQLVGGRNGDTFVFSTKLDAKKNVDTLIDFNTKNDLIALDNSIFKGLNEGKLSKWIFDEGSKHKTDKDDRIIFDDKRGDLYFDRDGSGSNSKAIKFAHFDTDVKLSASDFIVV